MPVYYQTGLHSGECVGQFMDAPQGKSPYFALKFVIQKRIVNNEEHTVDQQERTVYLYLTDKALEMTSEILAHLGYDKDSLRWLDPKRDGYFNFVGKKCDLWCKHEEYQGEVREKWSISMPFAEATPLDDKELRRLDALFGKAMKGKVKPSGNGILPGVPPEQRAAAGVGRPDPTKPPTEDEIPF